MGQITSEYKGKKQFKDMDTGQVFEVDYIKKIENTYQNSRLYVLEFQTFKNTS